ncbi:hypothetical protein KIPB_008261, partial [Kipferlia bialata]|eukprot:g8261.t1
MEAQRAERLRQLRAARASKNAPKTEPDRRSMSQARSSGPVVSTNMNTTSNPMRMSSKQKTVAQPATARTVSRGRRDVRAPTPKAVTRDPVVVEKKKETSFTVSSAVPPVPDVPGVDMFALREEIRREVTPLVETRYNKFLGLEVEKVKRQSDDRLADAEVVHQEVVQTLKAEHRSEIDKLHNDLVVEKEAALKTQGSLSANAQSQYEQ